MRAEGIRMIAIGVTSEIDPEFLKEMSSPPQVKILLYYS